MLTKHTMCALPVIVVMVLLIFSARSAAAGTTGVPPRRIAVFGSSVASGSIDHQGKGGYAGRLHDLLAPRGWDVFNVSKGGDNTITIAPRFDTDLIPQHPGYVVIGLSLSNEGIAKQKDKEYRERIFAQWRAGIQDLMKRCRDAGMPVVIGGCYARNSFTQDPELYEYTQRMNLEISRFDAPSINFLGAVDDGAGGWAAHFEANDGHPSGAGHQEMFLAIVPSLFEALEARKPVPSKEPGSTHAFHNGGEETAPLLFAPEDTMHSFAVSFWVKPLSDGIIAEITGKAAGIKKEMTGTGGKAVEADMIEPGSEAVIRKIGYEHDRLFYEESTRKETDEAGTPEIMQKVMDSASSPHGATMNMGDKTLTVRRSAEEYSRYASDPCNKGGWHHIVVSHWCARGETQFYSDGVLCCKTYNRFIPEAFYLCGGHLREKTAQAHYKEWCVYRSALSPEQVRYLYEGNLFQSSLEVYAPLADASFSPDTIVENRAQSMSKVKVIVDALRVVPN